MRLKKKKKAKTKTKTNKQRNEIFALTYSNIQNLENGLMLQLSFVDLGNE